MKHHEHHHDHDATEATASLPDRHRGAAHRRRRPRWSTSPTATPSSCGSRPSPSRSATTAVRMLAYNGSIPGPTLRVPPGLGARRRRHQRRRPRGDRPLARPAPRQPLRRHPRDPGADPGRRDRSPTGSRSPIPASTGTTRTSARTTARRWACTATSSSTRPTPDYWPPVHRELAPDPRRRPRRGRRRSLRSAAPRRPTRRWAASATCMLVGGETELSPTRPAGRGRPLLPHEHRQHPRVQRRPPRRPDEARRRRQRPRRARGVRRVGDPGPVGARRRRRAASTEPGRLTLEHQTPERDLHARPHRRHR